MRNIIVITFISLDGVMQAPGGPKEDTSGDFKYGGWMAHFRDEISAQVMRKQMQPADYLLGRKTFENWESYWPLHTDIWPGINDGAKHVLSRTRKTSDWNNSFFIENIDDIKTLKQTEGPDLQVWGSSELVHLLLKHDLVDQLWLKIFPITLGKGKRLFDDAIPAAFALTESVITSRGVIVASYKRDGDVLLGQMGA